jgi:hypothetical protein
MEGMKRYHGEMLIIGRQHREGLKLGKELPAGYYRKRDAHDCGRSRCGICHPDKRFGHSPTRQERLADLRLLEELSG